MPAALDAAGAWSLGRTLAPLAEEGVLIVGSGSLTHNLYEFRGGPATDAVQAPYALEFAAWVRRAVEEGDRVRLLRTLDEAPHARRAHPTAEHFWPLLVAAGAADLAQPVQVIEGGIVHGVLSMDSYLFGGLQGMV
jgi:4,5-DOPA dioxygenase extradiol